MSTLPTGAPSEEATPNSELVQVAANELIVGRLIEHPVYDSAGVLLLAAGNTITSEFKRLLAQRGDSKIQVHRADAGKVRLTAEDFTAESLTFDPTITAKMDRVVDSGLFQVQNLGPALSTEIVQHGKSLYDEQTNQRLVEAKSADQKVVSSLVTDGVYGRVPSGGKVNQLAASYLSNMVDDVDQTLSVMLQSTGTPELAEHCLKMAMLGMALAAEMGFDEDNCRRTFVAGLVHDWGMAKIPEFLWRDQRIISDEEYLQVQKHPGFTAEMIEKMSGLPSMVAVIAYQVHERPNGTGYPRNRTGERIHILARILGVADLYTSLLEERPHRKALMPYAAMECCIRLAKTRDVDPEVVRALLKVMCLFPVGSFVVLDDGSVAKVIRRNGEHYATPIVLRVQDGQGNSIPPSDEAVLDLAESEVSIAQPLPTPGSSEMSLTREILVPMRPLRFSSVKTTSK